jgi:uncharacterized membrane protein HdeD (DUF308 family)
MKWIVSSGAVLVVVGLVVLLLHVTWLSVALIVIGAALVLIAVFRRYGRPGDFSRSGWTGQ